MRLDLTTFTRVFDTFTQIEDGEFDAVLDSVGRNLIAANHEVFACAEHSSIDIGALELSFDGDKIIQICSGHAGARVFTNQLFPQPDDTGMPTEVRRLDLAETAIGTECRDVLGVIERANVHGHEFLIAGFVFDFRSVRIGFENFERHQGKQRSQIVLDPEWPDCSFVSLLSGETRITNHAEP